MDICSKKKQARGVSLPHGATRQKGRQRVRKGLLLARSSASPPVPWAQLRRL